MFRHVVMFKWNDDVEETHIEATSAALTALVATIPEVGEYRHGPDVKMTDGNFDYVVVGEYASANDYAVYRDHPDHKALIQQYIAPHISDRAAVQYEA
ncbi:MAG: hypothetical protein ACI8V4_001733 [Ilumatobacter sp.]|jgi:hypothetical protein